MNFYWIIYPCNCATFPHSYSLLKAINFVFSSSFQWETPQRGRHRVLAVVRLRFGSLLDYTSRRKRTNGKGYLCPEKNINTRKWGHRHWRFEAEYCKSSSFMTRMVYCTLGGGWEEVIAFAWSNDRRCLCCSKYFVCMYGVSLRTLQVPAYPSTPVDNDWYQYFNSNIDPMMVRAQALVCTLAISIS